MKKIFKWIGKRAKEPSTYVGAAAIATAIGAEEVGVQIQQTGQVILFILGGGLMAATTKAEEE